MKTRPDRQKGVEVVSTGDSKDTNNLDRTQNKPV